MPISQQRKVRWHETFIAFIQERLHAKLDKLKDDDPKREARREELLATERLLLMTVLSVEQGGRERHRQEGDDQQRQNEVKEGDDVRTDDVAVRPDG